MRPLVTIGFINYGNTTGYSSKKYLPEFLKSLFEQTYTHVEILCLDNASEDDSLEIIKQHTHIKIIPSKTNLGFIGHNELIKKAKGKYYWCLNFDMVLDKHMLERLVDAAESHKDGGSFGGTLLQWDIKNQKQTNIVDTTGLTISHAHYFRERDTGKHISVENLKQQKVEEVFGISGANVLYRMDALHDVVEGEQHYFDTKFFMYKEDIDLAYRLQWQGWGAYYVPQAIGWHDRTLTEKQSSQLRSLRILKNRGHKSTFNRKISTRNHLYLLFKNFSQGFTLKVKLRTFWDEIRRFFYILLCEPSSISAYRQFFFDKKTLTKTKKKALPGQIEKFMQ